MDDFQQQISELEQNLMQKTHEVEIMQNELKQVKEFRRKRAQMQKELEEVSLKLNMYLTICKKKFPMRNSKTLAYFAIYCIKFKSRSKRTCSQQIRNIKKRYREWNRNSSRRRYERKNTNFFPNKIQVTLKTI